MEKYHKTDIPPIEKENERDETYQGENESIDSARTHNNYHIVKRDENYTEYIKKWLDQENKRPRKDAVLMCSFVIGSDGPFLINYRKNSKKNSLTMQLRISLKLTERKISYPPLFIWMKQRHTYTWTLFRL